MLLLGTIIAPIRFYTTEPTCRYAIDIRTGKTEKVKGVGLEFSEKQLDDLKLALLNLDTTTEEKEKQGFLKFFNDSGYYIAETDRAGKKWYPDLWQESHLTKAVMRRWRIYQRLTVDVATKSGRDRLWTELWELPDNYEYDYPEHLLNRALSIAGGLGLPGEFSIPDEEDLQPTFRTQLERLEPLDLIWARIQIEALAGFGYRKCESKSCPKYFRRELEVNDRRKMSKRFCKHACSDPEGKRNRKKKADHKWRTLIKDLKKRLPAEEKENRSEWIAKQALEIDKDFPYAANWVTTQLRKLEKKS